MAVAVSAEQQADTFVRSPHKLLIDGDWLEAASGQTFTTLNPATEEPLAEVAHGQAEDIERAVRAARKAFADDSPWRRMNASDRGRLIWRISELIEENADELAMLESLDNGKPYSVARAADVPLAADLFRYMAGWTTKIEGSTVPISALPAPGEYLAYTLREPVGVVGQIIPWNFPLLMAAWKLGPVLACACTVVLKPAEQTPLSALRLGELMQEAGLPEGVVNIVTGFGDAGAALAAHDDVDKVAFTGSTEVGKLIVQAAAGNLKKVSLELGASRRMSSTPTPTSRARSPGRRTGSSSTTGSAATRALACTSRRGSSTTSSAAWPTSRARSSSRPARTPRRWPTTPTTAWPPVCSRATSPRRIARPSGCARARCGSTPTTCSTQRCRSAATRSPAGAARWARRS
jgi:Aldehyde dehydrogenase family